MPVSNNEKMSCKKYRKCQNEENTTTVKNMLRMSKMLKMSTIVNTIKICIHNFEIVK